MELYQALITLDGWTFLAQICNLMIQLVIFKKFLLKPIKQVIADRKAKADSEIAAGLVFVMRILFRKFNILFRFLPCARIAFVV